MFLQEHEQNGDVINLDTLNLDEQSEEDRYTEAEKNKQLQDQLEVCFLIVHV